MWISCFLLVVGLFSSTWGQPVADKVKVSFYAESLCPDCIQFTKDPLNEAFSQIPDIFILDYVPWGNAKLLSDGEFECQHGEMECVMNTYYACVLHYYPGMAQFWPFLKCAVGYGESLDPKFGDECSLKEKFNIDYIKSCRTGKLGHDLELVYHNRTRSTKPAQHYTPWVTINGNHDVEAEEGELISAICGAYRGSNKPSACTSS